MDDIIERIIGIEKKAQSIINEARDEKRAYEQTVTDEISAYRGAISADYGKKAGAYAEQMKAEADAGVKRAEDDARRRIAQMRETAELHKSEWIDQLARKIIDGEI